MPPSSPPMKGLRPVVVISRSLLPSCYDCPLGNEQAARNPEFQRLVKLQTEAFAKDTPYHSLELNDGTVIPGIIPVENLRARIDAYPIPHDLRGTRVLDIGAASGWN